MRIVTGLVNDWNHSWTVSTWKTESRFPF